MPKRLFVIFSTLFASPAIASEHEHGHGHTCLEHHWADPAYYHEIRWQIIAIILMIVAYAGARMLTIAKRRVNR